MSQQVLLKAAGLYSFPNRLSSIPQGALIQASNIVINRDNIAESRRGFKIYGNAMGSGSSNSAHQLINYKDTLLRHFGSGAGQVLEYDVAGNFVAFKLTLTGNTTNTSNVIDNLSSTAELFVGMYIAGSGIVGITTIASIIDNNSITISTTATSTNVGATFTFTYKTEEVVQGLRIKSVEQNGNLYFTSSEGIKKISAATSADFSTAKITNAGGIKALDLLASINNTNGFLLPQNVVAYRVVWGIKDANNNLILGAPSERVIIKNTDSTDSKTVDLKITIPQGITTTYFYQIYRTAAIPFVLTSSFSGDTTNTSITITNIADTSSLTIGMTVSGTGIPAGTTITSIPSTTSVELSQAATATNTGVNFSVSIELDSVDPGDEEGLVYEANPASADLDAGYLVINDITPESFRGANLYTNANSGEGIAQANNVPPLARDITSFKGYTFYANTRTKQRLNLSLLSITQLVSGTSTLTVSNGTTSNTYTFTSTNLTANTTDTSNVVTNLVSTSGLTNGLSLSGPGIQDGTTIIEITNGTSIKISLPATATTVGATLTFATESSTSRYIALSQLATPSQEVDETARSLVRIINSQDGEIIEAAYISGVNDVPGSILLESRALNQAAFYLTVNNTNTGGQFSPTLPTSGNSVISTNETSPNRIYYSKFQQPEAVPLLNYIDVGPKDKDIVRVLGLRDSLFILKKEGVYRLSGNDAASFQVFPFDFSTNIVAADSAVILNNLIYLFTNQGVATISDSGVNIISRPIEDKLIKLISPQYTNFGTATFGLSYESDRAYYLWTVTNTSDVYATQCFRFNTFTNSWTILDLSKRSGIVNEADDKLYLGATDTNFLEQERKFFDRTDYADREYNRVINTGAVSGLTITLPSIANLSVGDIIVQTQYLTIAQFNRLLTKLDRDALLSPKNYVSSLTQSAGCSLSDALDDLITKIANDAGRLSVAGATLAATYTALSPVSSTFSNLQTAYNSLITLLNNDNGVGYSNYESSSDTVEYEFPIVSIDKNSVSITTDYTYPLIAGPIVAYNHINTALQFVPQFLTDVSITKQVSEGTFIFEDSGFTRGTISYASDLSADFEDIIINGTGTGIFGSTIYGEGLFGGNGSAVPFRTYIPREKQRCRYLNCKFQHSVAREIFSLYGLSLSFNPMSNRGWR